MKRNSNKATRGRMRCSDISKKLILRHPDVLKIMPLAAKVFPYTMVGLAGLYHAYRIARKVRGMDGAIVELGCGNGGCGVFLAAQEPRKGTWLFDSFQGLPEFTEHDKPAGKNTKPGSHKAQKENVFEVANKVGVSVNIIDGWIEDTLPKYKEKIGDIALLRIDVDMYISTKFALTELYDQIVPGGFIILDDYSGWSGSRKAVYEFFAEKEVAPLMGHIDLLYPAHFRK